MKRSKVIARGTIQKREEDEGCWWVVEVEIPTRQHTVLTYELTGNHDTPGQALDAMIKWAVDRGGRVELDSPLKVYRNLMHENQTGRGRK